MVGTVAVGGDAPVTVQTMTNTPTSDAAATIAQIRRCEEAGVDIIRVSCPDVASTAALREIVRAVQVPIVADIHFHYKRALEAADAGAACLRINPGNIGSAERVKEVISAARANGCAIRIGVNAGSLERAFVMKMDVGDDRHIAGADDLFERGGALDVGAGHADDVDPGLLAAADLRDRRSGVAGRRVGHRLDGDGRVAPDGDLADHDLAGLAARNVAPRSE